MQSKKSRLEAHKKHCEKHFQPDDYVCGTKNLASLYDPKTSKDQHITDRHNYYQQPVKEIAKLKQKLKLKNKEIKASQSKNIRKEKTIQWLLLNLRG